MNKYNPYLDLNTKAINRQDDVNDPDYNVDLPLLYEIVLAEEEMKIKFIVRWNDLNTLPTGTYEFEVVKMGKILLSSIDKTRGSSDEVYPQAYSPNPTLDNSDPTIVSSLFDRVLNKYKITLNSIVTHSFRSFESSDFTIDPNVFKEIELKINDLCCDALKLK